MKRLPRLSAMGLALGGLLFVPSACLPGDERPEPGQILVTARPSEATKGGFTTEDGWTITFDRFLTALGNVDLDGLNDVPAGPDGEETCSDYSQTNYEWLIDFAVAEKNKVGLVHGLGRCTMEYRLRGPSDDTVLGQGATESDITMMDMEGADEWVVGEETSLVVLGQATRGDEWKLFLWQFRSSYEVSRCVAEDGEGDASSRVLEGGDQVEIPLVVRGEELFRETADDAAPLLFDRLAAADLNGDGGVFLDELALVPMPPELLQVPEPPGAEEGGDDDGFEQPETLGDLVYRVLLPRVTRVEGGGPCRTDLRD